MHFTRAHAHAPHLHARYTARLPVKAGDVYAPFLRDQDVTPTGTYLPCLDCYASSLLIKLSGISALTVLRLSGGISLPPQALGTPLLSACLFCWLVTLTWEDMLLPLACCNLHYAFPARSLLLCAGILTQRRACPDACNTGTLDACGLPS